jgi:26S proteasome regulatory subunit N3
VFFSVDGVMMNQYSFTQAMRYPLNAHRKELAAAEGARERERELAKEIVDGGDLDGDDDIGGF